VTVAEALEFAFNLFDPAVKADPYPHYEQMRAAGRVLRNPFLAGQFMLHRHADVSELLSDPETFGMELMGGTGEAAAGELMRARTMLNSNPPEHERLRGVVARAFTSRSIASLEPRSEAVAAELVAPLADGAAFDVVSELADRLPVLIIAEMLGVATSDLDDFVGWSHGLMGGVDILAPAASREHAIKCSRELHDYFACEVERRRARPADHLDDDLVGRIVAANADGRMSHDEVLSACVLLLLGGNETTAKLIANAVLALHRHPDERARLVADPALLPTAVEECLRYDTPVQGDARVAQRDVELAGVDVQAGSLVVALLGSANRDPDTFDEPDRFDVGRDPNPHLSFGRGIHYCLGANLSRIEARAAIGAILRVTPDYSLIEDGDLTYEGSFFFHAPSKLVIEAIR
jgi:cytochrome P450